jgi:2-amino-4-hydroxy-6-hydroxymethyldihydropteridine diphosphokinase
MRSEGPNAPGGRLEHKVLLSLGSNLGDRESNTDFCLMLLKAHTKVRILAVSEPFYNPPVGPQQPEYLNTAVLLETDLDPLELLEYCGHIERVAGRTRGMQWGPRTLDVDLVIFDDMVVQSDELTLPHPRFREREFVLRPAAAIAPEMVDPVTGKSIAQLLEGLANGSKGT